MNESPLSPDEQERLRQIKEKVQSRNPEYTSEVERVFEFLSDSLRKVLRTSTDESEWRWINQDLGYLEEIKKAIIGGNCYLPGAQSASDPYAITYGEEKFFFYDLNALRDGNLRGSFLNALDVDTSKDPDVDPFITQENIYPRGRPLPGLIVRTYSTRLPEVAVDIWAVPHSGILAASIGIKFDTVFP